MIKFTRIFIDPGHGGKDPGATNGIKEAEYALKISKALRKRFTSKKRKFKFTRKRDKYVDLNKRWQMANRWKADLSLCVHLNSAEDKKVRGSEVYYYGKEKKLAQMISSELAKGLKIPDRGAKEHAFAMTKYPTMPAVLIEVDFISNNTFAKKLQKKEYIELIAKLIYQAIRKYEKSV